MSTPYYFEEYMSARGTPRLVGHLWARDKITDAILDFQNDYLIYVSGQGGIGKTRLVVDVLQYPPHHSNLLVALDLIDLYHIRNHSLSGLIGAFLYVLKGFSSFFRKEMAGDEKWKKTAMLEQEGLPLAEIVSQQRELTDFFLDALNKFKGKKRLVLALDTAERLLLADDPIQKRLGLTTYIPTILDWLLNEFCTKVDNSVIILAGRPGEGLLRKRLETIQCKIFLPLELKGLTETEALNYFEALKATCDPTKDKDRIIINLIENLTLDNRKTIYHYLCEWGPQGENLGVRPILLSLVIDNFVISGRPFAEILNPNGTRAPSTAHNKGGQELEEGLVQTFFENNRLADDIIQFLALTPKGMNAELLAQILEKFMGRSGDEAADLLDKIRDLSFVKIRPLDQRIFLHDEIFELFNRHYWASPARNERASNIRKIIIDFYGSRIKVAKDTLAELNLKILAMDKKDHLEEDEPEVEEIIKAHSDLRDLLVEQLYYQMEEDPEQGFETYYKYSEEAILSNDESLDIQLRVELLAFLSRHPQENGRDGYLKIRRIIESDSAIRWLKRLVQAAKHDDAHRVIHLLRGEAKDLIQKGGALSEIELNVWDAKVDTLRAEDLDTARKILERAIARLKVIITTETVRQKCILARAYNELGYVSRSQGRYYGASDAYRKALPLWRELMMENEQAVTLTNHAFAMAQIGEFHTAWRQAWDGLKLRERQGRRSSMIFSLNTLAIIRTQENELDDAIYYAEKAIGREEQLHNSRARGLAYIAAAEPYRRISDWDKNLPHNTADLLQRSCDYAEKAKYLFTEEVDEPARLVEALLELGCAYRDWAKFANKKFDNKNHKTYTKEEIECLSQKSREAFEKAAQICKAHHLPYRRVDAQVNLAWLYYYIREEIVVEEALKGAYKEIPPSYFITPVRSVRETQKGGLPKLIKEDVILPYSIQLGKAELVLGQIWFHKFEISKDLEILQKAVEHYTISLAYDTLFDNVVSRDLHRAMDRIHRRIKTLNPEELAKVCQSILETEEKYNIPHPSRMWTLLAEHGLISTDGEDL